MSLDKGDNMIYFDNSATTKTLESSAEIMKNVLVDQYFNPASASKKGLETSELIRNSAKSIANVINCDYEEIYFTSGGTEGDNWAIFGTAKGYARSGKHIITTKTEHPAVLEPLKILESEGFEVSYLSVDEKGYINIDELESLIRKDTILVSIIFSNNETGTVQDMERIGSVIKSKNPETIFHTDAVQSFGKCLIDVKKMKIDILTASGHKFNAPKGTGFNYMKKGLKVKPLVYGGGQQRGQRSGTENPAMAMALADAVVNAYENLENSNNSVMQVKEALWYGIVENIPDVKINGEEIGNSNPYVLNVGFKNIRSEVLLHALEEKDIYVSAGSACDSRKKSLSNVLLAMGVTEDFIEGSIRFSFSRFNTVSEALKCVEALCSIVPMLRRVQMMRR